MQVTPSGTKTEQLSSEISEIKNWFENNAHTFGLVNCNAERSYIPRWDRSKDADDRIEFDTWVNAENKICLPKVAGTGLQFGRMKFVAKKRNNNSNGNGNIQGVIVSFIPFQNFTGDITKVSTTTFRQMQFSGIIAFEEVNGCLGNAYLIDQGIVKSKLTIQNPNQITPRCGEVYIVTSSNYTMFTVTGHPEYGCTLNYTGSSQSYSYGVPCFDSYGSVGSSGNYGSSSASGTDATYSGYLAPAPITNLCVSVLAAGFTDLGVTRNQTAGTGNSCLAGQQVFVMGGTFGDISLPNSGGVHFPAVLIGVQGLDNLYSNTTTANTISNNIAAAYIVSVQTWMMNRPPLINNNVNDTFAQLWMDSFNNVRNSIGQFVPNTQYCLTIEPLGNPSLDVIAASKPLAQATSSCR